MIDAKQVHGTLAQHQLVDGYSMVMDLERSHGSWLVDAVTGEEYLDCFTCFASWPIGYNHPALVDAAFREELLRTALVKPANSDLYTREMAAFVDAFGSKVTPPDYPHHFWVSGGALAVENAIKTAFDWKAKKLGRTLGDSGNDLVILHFREAFHGRSGYTMSLTNTDPTKTALFPQFSWPRVTNPKIEFDLEGGIANDVAADEARACEEIEAAFREYDGRIAAILIEPIQGEGGDNHFRPEFLAKLREFADRHEALLVFDEVQTGFFGTGKAWMWQHAGVAPDVVAFGKKTQVCGIYANKRIDEVPDNVFVQSSRINSTWGGNLVDMVRARKIIEIVTGENLADNVSRMGDELVRGMREMARQNGGISNVRGKGSFAAFTLESPEVRDRMIADLEEKRLLALKSGPRSIRFRLPLNINANEVSTALERIAACLPSREPV